MIPTAMARDWEKVDGTLAGVLAFADIDKAIDRRDTESIPADAATARQVLLDAPRIRSEADRRAAQVNKLREVTGVACQDASEKRGELRDERRRLRRRVFVLHIRLKWLQVSTAVVGAGRWLLTALPRLFNWIGRVVSSPFRSRTETPFDDDEDDLPPRRRSR